MERQYSGKLLREIREKQYTVEERGLPILVKPVPDDDRKGVLDPRVYAMNKKQFSGLRGWIARRMMKKMAGKAPDLEMIRKMMNGVKSIPITSGVAIRWQTVQNGDVAVPVRVYTPEGPAEGHKPVLFYIHGGGFVAGRFEVVEQLCKLFVQKTGWPCVSVEYRLAPEHPYPAGLDDCFAVLRWVYENAASFGGDAQKICAAGDSAGGNLAEVCALKDRDGGARMVAATVLLYPTVNMAGAEDENYRFSTDEYTIAPEQENMILPMITLFGGGMGELGKMLGAADPRDPYLSPYLADLSGLPPCMVCYGEFDFLRVECEAFARKMKQAGGAVKAVRYCGLSHAFCDMVGVLPQAEDCVAEIGEFMGERLLG